MKRYSIVLTVCLIANTAYAQQRIPDMSLSPEETMRLPDVSAFTGYAIPTTIIQAAAISNYRATLYQ